MADKNYRKRVSQDKQAELYKGFRKAGGRVVSLEERDVEKQQQIIDGYVDAQQYEDELRQKEAEIIRRKRLSKAREAQYYNGQLIDDSEATEIGDSDETQQKTKTVSRHQAETTFAVWFARLRCDFSGITHFFSETFTPRFFDFTLTHLDVTLREIQSILASVLHQEQTVTEKVHQRLNHIGREYYFELVYRIDRVHEPDLFQSIREVKDWRSQIKQGKVPFRTLFKKLYVLKQYVPVLKAALKAGLQIEGQIRALIPTIVQQNIKTILHRVDFVFEDYYPKILRLMEYYYKIRLVFEPRESFEHFLTIDRTDMVGYFTQLWREQKEMEARKQHIEAQLKAKREEANQPKSAEDNIENNDEIEDYIKQGLKQIMDNNDFAQMKEALEESKDPISILPVNDKVFLIFTLIEYFYRMYSLVFLSNQVQYNIFFDKSGTRVDLKSSMKDSYFKMNYIYQRIREYIQIYTQLKKMTNNFEIEVNEEYPQFKSIVNQRGDLLRIINYETRKSMENFEKIFYFVIRDYALKNQVVQNSNDYVDFRLKDQTAEFSSKMRVYEIFRKGYEFVGSFVFLLAQGDLNTSGPEVKEGTYIKLLPPDRKASLTSIVSDEKISDEDLDDVVREFMTPNYSPDEGVENIIGKETAPPKKSPVKKTEDENKDDESDPWAAELDKK